MALHPLVGHEDVRRSLANAHLAGALPSSLLLHGPRGVGKQRVALWLAQLSVCTAAGEDGPCDACGPCRMTKSLEHPDVHWYFPLERPKGVSGDKLAEALERDRHEALAEIRTNSLLPSWWGEVRGIYFGAVSDIRHRAARRPTMAEGPVFIIGQAEYLVPQESSQEAANALLKLLEEPPGAARFILTSSEPGLLLPTIRSRTVPLHVPPLAHDVVEAFLLEHTGVDQKTAGWAAQLGQGSPGRALAFLPDGDDLGPLETLRRGAYEIVAAATGSSPGAAHALALSFKPSGARGLLALFNFVEEWLRDFAAVAAGAPDCALNQDAVRRIEKHLATIEAARIPDAFPSVERARELARGNVNPQLIVSGLVRDIRTALHPAVESALTPGAA